jgi:hypothetical protein
MSMGGTKSGSSGVTIPVGSTTVLGSLYFWNLVPIV